jgi:hypothetical protein
MFFVFSGEDDGEILRRQLLKASIPNAAFRHKMLAMSGDIATE